MRSSSARAHCTRGDSSTNGLGAAGSAWTTWALGGLLAAFALGGCTCGPIETTDGGPATAGAELAFLSPLNNAVLTAIDDLDGTSDGLQITVRLQVDPAAAVDVTLLVDDVEVATVSAADERALFSNVTLLANAEGIEHTLRAEADGYKADSVTVTARVIEANPSCDFLTPADDSVDPPFSVTVACLGVGANEPATLVIRDDAGAPVGAAYRGQLDGNLRFTASAIDLEDGDYTLAFSLDNSPAASVERDITVSGTVVLPDPVCTITAPRTDAPPTTSPGFDVTVECADVPAGVTSVSVSLDGPGTDPVSFLGTLAPSAGVMTAVVPVLAAEAGATEISAEVVNFPSSVDTLTVVVPAFPVCDAEILQPQAGAGDLFDVDLANGGNQIVVRVGALGSPGHCSGALAVVTVDGETFSATLGGDSAQSGSATLVVTVPEGESTLSAQLSSNDVAGAADSVTITFTTPPVGIRVVGLPVCGGFGDGCLNLAAPNQGSGTAYQRNIAVVAPAQNGACPFTDPLLDVEGLDQDIRAAGDTDAAVGDAWSFNNGLCEATFTNVTLHPDESPDGVLRALHLEVALDGGASESRDFALGLDRVAPTLSWTTPDGAVFGGADDQDTTTAILDVALGATVSGMDTRSVVLVLSEDLLTPLDTCVVSGASDAVCAFVATLTDGAHAFDVVGGDAAGNPLENAALNVRVDSNGPCVASIVVAADADSDGDVTASEGGAAPISSDVTVTFESAACAIEDGRTVTLQSSLAADLGTGTTSGNAVTFTGVSLAEGTHTLSVQASDEAGNAVAASGNSADVIVDVTAPTCAIFLPTQTSLLASDDEVPGTPGLQVTFVITTDGASARLLVGGTEAGSGPAPGGTLTLLAVTLANGAPSITAECVDAAGNLATSAAYAPVIDGVLPTVAFNSPPATLGSADDAQPTTQIGIQTSLNVDVSLTEAGRPVAIYLADAQGAPTGNALGSASTLTDTTAGGIETLAVPATFLSCDACRYVAQVTDATGNAAVSATTTITVTSELHVCTFTSPDGTQDPIAIGAAFQSGNEASVAFTVSCPGLPSGATAELYVNDFVTAAQTVSATGESVTFAAVTLPVGSGQVQVLVDDGTDAGGTNRRDYLVDIESPAVGWAFTTPTVRLTRNAADAGADLGPLDNSDAAGFQGTLSATVTGCDGQAVIVTAGGVQVNAGDPPVSAGGVVSLPVSIPDGDAQELVVACADEVGNETVAEVTATVDTVPPAAPAVGLAWDSDVRGEIGVSFAEPGDDDTTDSATVTILARKNAALTSADCATPPADVAVVPFTSAGGGAAQQVVVDGLVFDVTWHFAVCAEDDVGNVGFGTSSIETATQELVLTAPAAIGSASSFGYAINRHRGDLNADGRDDLVIGAPGGATGSVVVVLGSDTASGLTQSVLASPATVPCAQPGGTCDIVLFGFSVHTVPSINGDEYDDLLVVASDAVRFTDFLLLYAGGPDGIAEDAAPIAILEGDGVFDAGNPTVSLGDIDGDDSLDWGVGTATQNQAYIFFNAGVAPASGMLADRADVIITNSGSGAHRAGYSLADVGDLDEDGYTDLVVSDFDQGRLYVVRGAARVAWPAQVDLATVAAPDVIFPFAVSAPTNYGWDLSAGDVNGDGAVDIGVLANDGLHVTLQSGGVFANSAIRMRASAAVAINWQAGMVVADLNGDSRADMLVNGGPRVGLFMGSDTLSPRQVGDSSYQANATPPKSVLVAALNLIGGATTPPDVVYAEQQSPGRVVIRY